VGDQRAMSTQLGPKSPIITGLGLDVAESERALAAGW
jgi:hypothetical protein